MKIDNFIENTILKDGFHRDKFRDYFDKYCILLYNRECEYTLENIINMFDDLFNYIIEDNIIYLYEKMRNKKDSDYTYTAFMTLNSLRYSNNFYKYLDEQLC